VTVTSLLNVVLSPGVQPDQRHPVRGERERTMSNEQAVPETIGVTAEVLATVDLGPEIEGMAGRELRMRLVTMEPGGVFRGTTPAV
jgi:hypothetical protein